MRLENVSDVYPLSPMQEGMLFHTVSEPELGAYVDQAVVTISGTIDPQRFNDSVQRVFSKFDSLKTAFIWEEVDQPLQIVRDDVQFPFESRNWQTRSNEQQRQDLLTLIAEQRVNGFELEQAPLVRVFLCQCSTTNWKFTIVFHHLILDGWSTHKLVDQLLADYQEEPVESRGSEEFRFRDYIQWMINQDQESASKFWKQELADFKKPNEIGPPTVFSLDAPEEGKFHQNELRLDKHLSTSLREFARQNRVTINTLMQAAWSIIVGRYSGGATDVVFGTTVAGRPLNLDGVEEGIGSFINTIPFRTQLANDISLNHWLSQILTRQLDCRQWEFSSLVQIQKHSDVPAGTSLFESILVFENYPSTVREYGNLSITNVEHFEQSNYALAFLVVPKDEIELIVISKASRYPDSIIQLIPEHLKYLLEEFVKDSTQPLSRLLIALPPQQQQQLLSWCCVDEIHPPNQATVVELIHQAAKKTPGAVAVVFEDQQLTYQQLDERSDVVAQVLIDHGVDLEQAVGICVERSLEMIIGIVGILKSGCCYLPLDVIYPIEHFEHILEDSEVSIVLTSRLHKDRFPGSTNRKLLLLDEMESYKPPRDLPSMSNPDRLAYIIYTSGSTGKPKGVMITHQNLSQSTLARIKYYQENPQSYLLLSSFAFDSSVAGIFWTLCTGGKLVLPRRNAEQDMVTLIALLQREKVSHILCLPALYQVLVETSHTDQQLSALRVVIVAGDKVSASVANAHFKYAPQVQLHNEYGPTEGTVWATAHQIKSTRRSIIPIGKPIDSTGVVLLDSNDRPVPIGATGEICLTGHGLARGYLNNADLTNRKFAEGFDYFGSAIRIYRTGDVGYFQQDGSLVFCGRTDQQVKVRGYRIEPGEIESALVSFDDVDDVAVVTHRESESSPSRILAFVSGKSVTEDRQRWVMRLNQRLPEFMIPDLFMRLEKIPRLPNGKVDRTALPKPKRMPLELKQPNMAPSGDIQTQLASIWKEVLGLDEVGIDEDFFELGGDSILSIKIVAKANQAGLGITPRHLFQYQTIAELAAVVGVFEPVTAEQGVVTGPLPLSPIQHWFFAQKFEEPHHWNMAWVLEAKQPLDPKKMEQVVKALLEHHDALRLRFVPHGPGWEQELGAPNEPISFTAIDLSHVADAEAEAAFTQETDRLHTTLNLTDGPLIRVALVHFGENQGDRLLLVIHHLAVDGVSWRILLDDLQTAYDQLCERESIQLPPKTTSFKGWTERLVEYAQSTPLYEEASYWQTVVNTPWTPFPRDFVDGINTVASTQAMSVVLAREDTQALLQDIPEVYHTQINDVLLAALVDVLAQWSQQETVYLDLEGHGREELMEDIDLSLTVGWFTSIFPVVLKGGHPAHPGELLKSVKEQLRQIPHRGIGYGLLRYVSEEMKIREHLGKGPDPEVSFNYLGQFDQVIPSDGPWRWSEAPGGATRHPRGKQPHLVAINARIMDSVLQVHWSFSEAVHRRATIEKLAKNYLAALLAIIRHCQLPDAGGYTPSDFPLAKVSQQELDRVLTHVRVENTKATLADLYPLTPLQQGLWFHALADPASGVYFEQSVSRIEGVLDHDVFRQAWQEIVARHAILRTGLIWEALEHPLQFVRPTVELPWAEYDWRGCPATEHQGRLTNFLDADQVRGFDLTQAPLMRLTLLQVTETAVILVWSFHHLILDRWSVDVVQQEVWAAYEALRQGRSLQLKSLRPFREYLGWLQDQDLNRAEQYWRQRLKGFTAPTVLGVDRAPPTRVGHQENSYASEEGTLSEAATTAISRWARQQQLTVNTVVQGAWSVLLSRYSGSRDVVFGTTVSGRSAGLPGIESMVGLFINTLPVRVHVSPSHSVGRWLTELQEQQVTLREYEYTPLYEIQKWSEAPPGESLFHTLLVFENIPLESGENLMARTAGLNVQPVPGRRGGETNYSLTVVVVPGRTLQVQFMYDTQHYTADAITRLIGHFQEVLTGMASGMEQQLLETIPLLTETERQQLLVEWNATQREYPKASCIHQCFEAQVARTPTAAAVVFEAEQLTYAQLNARANRLAALLQQQGVGPDSLVGLCVERSLEMLVGLLGILKAGAAFVPLDPTYPSDRLHFMIDDAQMPVIVTHQRFPELLHLDQRSDQFSSSSRPKLIDLDAIEWQDEGLVSANPISAVTPQDLMYVIYTSGSTGKPKGVMIAHRTVRNFLHAMQEEFALTQQDTFIALTSISFDISILELFGPLLVGGCVHLVSRDTAMDGQALVQALTQSKASLMQATPVTWQLLLDAEWPGSPGLRALCGGEALAWSLGQALLEKGVTLWNMYGPTETTVWSALHRVSSDDQKVPIGMPIANTQLYVLDAEQHLVPVGVPGELYIGGLGLSRGYWRREELTREKFVPHPFCADPHARLYRTGDRVSYRANGTLEFLGRVDHQVKLRGFRVELGEIEAVLTQHPGVKESVALVREDEPGEKRLVAYVVPHKPSTLSPSDLKGFLQQKFPSYMVPSSLTMLEALPLTPNGKFDRRALPAPTRVTTEFDGSFAAPRSPLEEVLVEMWKEVLDVEQVGVYDNFFELGGHSLKATQIISRVRDIFQVEVPLRQLFDGPTIDSLTKVIEKELLI